MVCIALVSSLGTAATAAPTVGAAVAADSPVTTIAKKKKKCRKGSVRKRVKLTKGRNKGKRVSRCVQKRKKPAVRQLAPV